MVEEWASVLDKKIKVVSSSLENTNFLIHVGVLLERPIF